MIPVQKMMRVFLRAMAVTVLACLAYLVFPQPSEKTTSGVSPELLLDRLQVLADEDEYEKLLSFADSIATVFSAHGLRTDWYKVLRIKTIAQKDHEQPKEALTQLLPIVQAQILDDSITAKLYGLLGFSYLNAGKYDQGTWYYERCLSGLLRHQCKTGIGGAYMNLGYSLKQQGDFRAARQYYLASLPLLRAEGNFWNLSEALINLGDISRYLFEFETARDYYRKAAVEYPDEEGRLASGLGWTYAGEGKYQEAMEFFRESCRQGPCPAELARIMGRCSEALGDTTEANRHFRLAIEHAGTALDTGKALSYLGHARLQRNQPDAALQVFQQALQAIFPQFNPTGPADNPDVGRTTDFWPNELLRGEALAFHALYKKNGDIQELHHAFSAITTAMAALDTLRTGMRNEISGQDAVDYAYATYEIGIRIALELDQTDPGNGYASRAYQMAEHAKSNVLKTNLLEKDIRRTIQIPDSLLWRENTALTAVAHWEEAGRPDSLLAAVRRLEKVQNEIEKQAPLLRKARMQVQNSSIAAIQEALKGDELLLHYFWGDSMVTIFAVGKDQLKIHSVPRSKALDKSIVDLRAALNQWRLPLDQYAAIAAPVYQQLCAPLLEMAGDVKRLIIVPDGPLWTVPFEALIKEDGRFLVENHAVSYHWSGALWLQARSQGSVSSQKTMYGGFAPSYPAATNPKSLADLPEARAAVAAVAEAWDGDVWRGLEVNKTFFQREAGRYGILHLAMHGLLDLQDRTRTGLAFPDSSGTIHLLNTLEISQMDLSAQLAVLSACNTGSGVVFRGEGVMSLSRAFALAGCPALTANLWEVPSKETNDITAVFLKLLKGGKSKDEALRSAKIDFLENAESERRHPFFWAGQVLVGNEQPIHRSRVWVWVLLVACVLGCMGWLVWRWQKSTV